MSGAVLCVDFGSTFTKAALVDAATGDLLGTAEHPTTIDTDVLEGYAACRAALDCPDDAEVLACSSAGGGLRIAVVGNEALVTAEAGRRVALSSGGKVVHVGSGGLSDLEVLREARPDVILLVGGTDGGNSEVLVHDAGVLGEAGWPGPVVVAGDVHAQADVAAALGRTPYVLADNVVPRIGVLEPTSARAAIREMFLAHVIGGKHLSASPDFAAMVRGATPDVVLTGVELLAEEVGDVVVVDIGGATTDVHSVIELDPEDAGLARDVVAPTRTTRTVEGDLGMHWSAVSTHTAAVEEGLLDASTAESARLLHEENRPAAEHLAPIAAAAATLAVRRHAGRSRVAIGPDGRVVERTGRDLREVDLLVGSGGVLRHGPASIAEAVFAGITGRHPEGWQLPEAPRRSVDVDYLLAPVGLLAGRHPQAARALVRRLARHPAG